MVYVPITMSLILMGSLTYIQESKMLEIFFLLQLCFMLVFCSCGVYKKNSPNTLEVVPYVDIEKYLGTWYEIGRYPNWFQKNCAGTTANYTLRDDGKIKVLNRCRENTLDGKEKSITGKAWIADKKTNAKLKVQFYWPFSGDYWIIQLDEKYTYAVVGHPGRKYLWILSRKPRMDENIYASILRRLVEQGYNPDRIIKTLQKQD